jgi:hypothetical protein
MALESTCRNLFGSRQLGDLSVVIVTLIAGSGQAALSASRSNSSITVATPGSGVYTVSFPCGTFVTSVGQETVNAPGTAPGDKLTISGAAISNSTYTCTVTKSDTTDLTGSEEIHLTFITGAP